MCSLFFFHKAISESLYRVLRGLQGYSDAGVLTSVKPENKIEVSNVQIEKIYVMGVDENGLQLNPKTQHKIIEKNYYQTGINCWTTDQTLARRIYNHCESDAQLRAI